MNPIKVMHVHQCIHVLSHTTFLVFFLPIHYSFVIFLLTFYLIRQYQLSLLNHAIREMQNDAPGLLWLL